MSNQDNNPAASGPQPEPQPSPGAMTRRRLLTGLSIALGAVGAGILGIPVIGFLVAPLMRRPPNTWRSVGAADSFRVGETVEVSFVDASPLPWAGVTAKTAAWLRCRGPNDFIAFSVNCTHLGCPVKWLPDASLFMCPCHGGVYYADGKVAAGPPPRGLVPYPVRVNNGQVEILTSPIPIV